MRDSDRVLAVIGVGSLWMTSHADVDGISHFSAAWCIETEGAAQIFSVFGFPWLSRLIRATVVVFWGRWGLPIPRRLPLMTCVGEPISGVTLRCNCFHAIQPRPRALRSEGYRLNELSMPCFH